MDTRGVTWLSHAMRLPIETLSSRHLLDDEPEDSESIDDTLTIRIIAVFVVLIGGLLGGLLPIIVKVFKTFTFADTIHKLTCI